MQRRGFCKLMAATAASAALPLHAQTADSMSADVPAGFDQLTEDYAQFCATPAHERVFYALARGKIVREKLDNATWTPVSPAWGDPPELPIPGGSWDGVPMHVTNYGSGRRRALQAHLGFHCCSTTRQSGIAMPNSASGRTGARSACRRTVTGMRAICIWRDLTIISIQSKHYGHPSQFGYKDLCAQWTLLNWEPDALIPRYKKAGAQLVHGSGQSS